LLVGGVLYAFSGLIVRGWFTAETIDIVVLEQGLQVIAIVLALHWPVSLYSGALAGVQRMDILKIVKASVIILRLVGGILVILVWRDLSLFLIWTALSALVEVLVFQVAWGMVTPEASGLFFTSHTHSLAFFAQHEWTGCCGDGDYTT
jgi:hypothetical protein